MSNSQHRFRPYEISDDEDLGGTNLHAGEGEVERVNAMSIFQVRYTSTIILQNGVQCTDDYYNVFMHACCTFQQLTATQIDMLAPTRIVPIPGRVRAKCKFYRLADIQASENDRFSQLFTHDS